MGSGELLHVVAEYIRLIKSKTPHVKYGKYRKTLQDENQFALTNLFQFAVCDPVIGDNNKLVNNKFISHSISSCQSCLVCRSIVCWRLQKWNSSTSRHNHTQWFRTRVNSLHSSLNSPNSIPFRQLIGQSIDYTHNNNGEDLIWQSFRSLHNLGPSHIIVSSIPTDKIGGNQGQLQMRASSKLAGMTIDRHPYLPIRSILDNQYQTFHIDFPRLEGNFTGTGDSFSALIVAWFHKEYNLLVSFDFRIYQSSIHSLECMWKGHFNSTSNLIENHR